MINKKMVLFCVGLVVGALILNISTLQTIANRIFNGDALVRNEHMRLIQNDLDAIDLVYTNRGAVAYTTRAGSMTINLAVYHGSDLIKHEQLVRKEMMQNDAINAPPREGKIIWGMRSKDDEQMALGTIDIVSQWGAFSRSSFDISSIDGLMHWTLSGRILNADSDVYIVRNTRIPIHVWKTAHPIGYGIESGTGGSIATNFINTFNEEMLEANAQSVILYVVFGYGF